MSFWLLPLDEELLRTLAAGRVPEALAPRLEDQALPPAFVATRALALLAQGQDRLWCCTSLIVRRADERIVGGCGFKGEPVSGCVEIGYGVSPAARGQGAATAAVRLLVEAAFAAGAREVLAEVLPANAASQRVVRKAGFAVAGSRLDEEGQLVDRWLLRNTAPGRAADP